MTKENQGGTNKQCTYNTVLLKTGLKSNHKLNKKKKGKKKETNSINIYGTHLWHKYAAVGLATFLSFFKPNYHGNSAKGEGVGRTRTFHRALAKIHSKKFKFYTKHLTLRVYKKCFFIGFWSIFT